MVPTMNLWNTHGDEQSTANNLPLLYSESYEGLRLIVAVALRAEARLVRVG